MNRDDLPPVVRCSRCGEVLIEANPTRRKVVCLRCLGVGQDEEAAPLESGSDFGE
jgi:formylmethanofuran dehydrogenase subunit E